MVVPADDDTITYTVIVLDTAVGRNEAPEFSVISYTFNFSEHVVNGYEVGTLTVTDNDGN